MNEPAEPAEPVIVLRLSDDRLRVLAIEIAGRIVRCGNAEVPMIILPKPFTAEEEAEVAQMIRNNEAMVRLVMSKPVGEVIPAEIRMDDDPLEHHRSLMERRQLPPLITPPTFERVGRTSKGDRRFPDPRKGRW